jgi:hypothetical protein
MHDGSISVVDIEKGAVIESIDTLKNAGLTPNNIILMSGGHAHGSGSASAGRCLKTSGRPCAPRCGGSPLHVPRVR